MNVLLNGDLIQVAVVWTVVVALLTKFPDFIYIYIYMSFADQRFLQTKIINLLILVRYAYTE
jgi:hypothetical protein